MGTVDRAIVHFVPGFDDERPQVVVALNDAETAFDSLHDAIAWARERAGLVGIRYDGSGDLSPGDPRVAELVRRWNLDQERFTAERETASHKLREWYLALEEPDVEGTLDTAAHLVEQHPGVVRVLTAETHDRLPLWFIDVMARTPDEAADLAHDAVFPVAWPDERLDRALAPSGGWAVSISRGNQTVGLVEYRHARFFSPWATT